MLQCPASVNNPVTGAQYFFKGACLIWHPKLRPFIIVPLLINIVLFAGLTAVFIDYFSALMGTLESYIADWLTPLIWVAWLVIGTFFLLVYAYSFNIITNFLAAPFYGVLSERTEMICSGECPPEESLKAMIPRVFAREIQKLFYFLVRGIFIMIIMILVATTQIISFLAPLIGIAWGAWSMSIQYVDYAADNHQYRFKDLRTFLWQRKYSSFGFGSSVMLFTLVPVVNIFVMPAAVVGGTLFWAHELKKCTSATTGDCPQSTN